MQKASQNSIANTSGGMRKKLKIGKLGIKSRCLLILVRYSGLITKILKTDHLDLTKEVEDDSAKKAERCTLVKSLDKS